MKAIVFNTGNSIINTDSETQMIKCGYLMADSICIAGQLGANLLFEEEHQYFGIVRKVQFLYDGLLPESVQNDDKEAFLEALLQFMTIAKEFPQMKNPTSELALAYNNSRRVFSEWFDSSKNDLLVELKKSGFLALSSLASENKVETKLLNISMGRYSHSKHEAESNAKMILELIFPNNKVSEPLMFMLPIEFTTLIEMLQEEENDKTLNEEDDEYEEDDTFECLVHVLTLPEIKDLTGLQLKALNTDLSEHFKNINIKLEAWIQYCKKSNNTEEIFDHFKSNVFHHFASMQEIIDKNQTLIDIKNNPSFNATENNYYIGICPVDLLWIYFEIYRIVDKETLAFLKKRYANNKSYPEFLPVLHVCPELVGAANLEKIKQKEGGDELEKNHRKMYLNID